MQPLLCLLPGVPVPDPEFHDRQMAIRSLFTFLLVALSHLPLAPGSQSIPINRDLQVQYDRVAGIRLSHQKSKVALGRKKEGRKEGGREGGRKT